jgi:NAD(P)-dependent dehydrogenase (short-subunit alcohol dehydrogenase family)
MSPLDSLPLRGRSAIITGAARGIGMATALLFAEAGADLTLVDLDEEGLRDVTTGLPAATRAVTVTADVADQATARTVVDAAADAFGGIDILVNNAAVQIPGGTVLDATEDDWHRFFSVNVKGPANLARKAIPFMCQRGGGSIVNVGSLSSVIVFPGQAVYAASKGAILQLTRSIAVDFGAAGIRCNCICPGPVLSGPVLLGRTAEEVERDPGVIDLAAQHPLGRLAQPDDVANAALYLAGPYSGHVTGAMLVVDGGFSIR